MFNLSCYNIIGDKMNIDIINNMKKHNLNLSKYACFDEDAIRLNMEDKDIRTDFYRDTDRILYSLSYIRYIDKTQVYSNTENDMISKRILHVQLVSKIARTIGRALNLNEDLIEASSLGHDLGHVPFGHVGEHILNDISLKNNEGYFYHNIQSVRTLMYIENGGIGSNITLQVLDSIMCHNGERLCDIYKPTKKDKDEFIKEYNNSYKDINICKNLIPMTLEGCVLKISDIIAYIGKDIDDAIRLNKIKKSDIPKEITDILGNSNRSIINTVILDIINNSINKNYIKLSPNIFNALNKLLKFNYENIYLKANSEEQINKYKDMFEALFNVYKTHLKNNKTDEDIYTLFINDMSSSYKKTTENRIIIDYIAGMTDDFFISQYNKYVNVNK